MAQKLKLKQIKLGKKSEDFAMHEDVPSAFPPSFDVDEGQMPEIKDWKVGETYRMVVDVEMKSSRETDKDKQRAGFNVVAYKYMPKKTLKDLSDKELEGMQAQGLEA